MLSVNFFPIKSHLSSKVWFNPPHPWTASPWLYLIPFLAFHSTGYFYHTCGSIFQLFCMRILFLQQDCKSAWGESHMLLCVLVQFQAQLNARTHIHTCSVHSWQNRGIVLLYLGPAFRTTCFTSRFPIFTKEISNTITIKKTVTG